MQNFALIAILVLSFPLSDLALLFSGVDSWTFVFDRGYYCFDSKTFILTQYKVVETLNYLEASVKITENSENVSLGVFLRKFLDLDCEVCGFSSILHIHDGDINVYFRDVTLHCAAHARLFTEREGVVSKETVVLRRWGSSIQKFGFINGVDNVNWPPYRDYKS